MGCSSRRSHAYSALLMMFAIVLSGAFALSNFADDPPYLVSDSDDMSGDDVQDAVVADPSFGGTASPGEVRVTSGDGGELLVSFMGKEDGDKFGYAVAIVDSFNSDLYKDIVIGAPKEGTGFAYVFFGPFDETSPLYLSAQYANLTLASPEAHTFDFGAGVASLPDISGDGLEEVMVRASFTHANSTQHRTYIFRGGDGAYLSSLEGDATYRGEQITSGTILSCYGDITGPGGVSDGVVNVNDLLVILNTWGACSPPPAECPGDIAPRPIADAVVNVNDMVAVINAWGPCPVQGIVYSSNGTGGGDWFDPNTWNPPGVPGTQQHFDVVLIRSADAITQSANYAYTLGLYYLEDGCTHHFHQDAGVAALDVAPYGQWTGDADIEPLIVIKNARSVFKPRYADITLQYDCPTFCMLLANPFYPFSTLESCTENPCTP